MRFSTDDPTIKPYIDRVLQQAERDSGIGLTRSGDKFASLRITPTEEVVYADGKQARLDRSKAYTPRKVENAARRYLFEPQVRVTLARAGGAKATFSKKIIWDTAVLNAVKQYPNSDTLDLYVFPKRKRVVLTVTASSESTDCQFSDGAPSVFDLQGGTLAAQLLKSGDVVAPKVLDLDDVDRHGSEESMQLEATLAPRVRSTIVSILCATSPQGSVELGVDDSVVERSSVDGETLEISGPVALVGFPNAPANPEH
jgi:hypothetical protein